MSPSRQQWRPRRPSRGRRGQSNPLGMILVFAIMIAGATAIVALGAVAMEDTEQGLSEQRAEKVMTQLDSKAALVALGNTEIQRVALPRTSDERFSVREDSGWMNISVKNETSGDVTEIANETLGEVVYEGSDGKTISYQGGGVWRSERTGQSTMISPPEFHYRGATLTLPLVSVDGEDTLTNRATISNRRTTKYFPNTARDEDFANPLQSGQINVTVRSTHYEGWGHYFEERTEGTVVYDHDNETVTAELVVPFDEDLVNVIATTESDGITVRGNNPKPSPYGEGIAYPPVDEKIEDKISTCDPNNCNSIPSTISSDGVYYTASPNSGGWDVDNPGGNVTVVINGEFTAEDIEIRNLDDGHSVTVLAREDVTVKDPVNDVDGEANDLRVHVHSDADVEFKGNSKFVGILYAPRSECNLRGGGAYDPNIKGGAICETMEIRGNPNEFEYDPGIEDADLGLNPDDVSFITYLHITLNEVTVTSG